MPADRGGRGADLGRDAAADRARAGDPGPLLDLRRHVRRRGRIGAPELALVCERATSAEVGAAVLLCPCLNVGGGQNRLGEK